MPPSNDNLRATTGSSGLAVGKLGKRLIQTQMNQAKLGFFAIFAFPVDGKKKKKKGIYKRGL